jgi:hypothetical protein
MFAIEANQMIDTLHDLYPSWNPTATQLEAIRHKLCQFPFADAKAAALETYEPGKRLAPVDAIKGNVFAMQWCDRHNIAYEKEQIPF